jgi:hypothetical protein
MANCQSQEACKLLLDRMLLIMNKVKQIEAKVKQELLNYFNE